MFLNLVASGLLWVGEAVFGVCHGLLKILLSSRVIGLTASEASVASVSLILASMVIFLLVINIRMLRTCGGLAVKLLLFVAALLFIGWRWPILIN